MIQVIILSKKMVQVIMKVISVTNFENACNAVTIIFLELIFSTAFQILLYKCVTILYSFCHYCFYTSLFVFA